MIPNNIKKILYATDLSKDSKIALSWALTIANNFGAKLVLLHTNENISQMGEIGITSQIGEKRWQELKKKIKRDAIDIMKKRSEQVCNEYSSDTSSCPLLVEDIVVNKGYPVERILHEAEDRSCDIVVMGTHQHGRLHKTMLGSTAQRVLRHSKKPVFVIPLSGQN